MKFSKPPKTFEEQMDLLENRGMIINDRAAASHHLAHLNYYRLTAYWRSFQEDTVTHRFKQGTLFDEAINLYMFDKKLRLLLLNAIERIEISARTQWAYHFAHEHGSHAYLNKDFSSNKDTFKRDMEKLKDEFGRSEEVFILHYKNTYNSPSMPPIWAICEIMSLGLLSRFYSNLNSKEVRKAIANTYNLNQTIMKSLLRHLAYVRNLCAYHSRIWNRKFGITMKVPRSIPSELNHNFNTTEERKLYNTLVLLVYMMNIINPSNKWKKRLLHLIDEHHIDTVFMGFPVHYMELSIWKS
uniref:Abortive infection bacteriophage resistance protein n=1 Tax=Candidatus Kentrum sp. SD TaxID=2126332 RepID=A0A450YI59_9GAMM|nr:MAG: Abortive infection bacteriophage resistance protein [Candidatus Kentron sp. SD]VFK41155.1 MAG: Abortive infection bacteriophage resistance protein [Candidatus Kentron sp. SD]